MMTKATSRTRRRSTARKTIPSARRARSRRPYGQPLQPPPLSEGLGGSGDPRIDEGSWGE